MKTVVVVFHPTIDESQLQQFLLAALEEETTITVHRIATDFLTKRVQLETVEQERQVIATADRIILQFPVYWYSCPAELKAWIDCVFEERWARSQAPKQIGIVVSFGIQANQFQAGKREQYTVSEMLRPFEMFANSIGWRYLPAFPIHQFSYLTEAEKQKLLVDYVFYLTDQTGKSLINCETWLIEYAKKFSMSESKFIQTAAWQEIANWLVELHDERMELRAFLQEMEGD